MQSSIRGTIFSLTGSANDWFAFGEGGAAARFDGAAFVSVPTATQNAILGSFAVDREIFAVGAGGMIGADAVAKLEAGASLVQIYTGLIYRGPALVRRRDPGRSRNWSGRPARPMFRAMRPRRPGGLLSTLCLAAGLWTSAAPAR